MSVVMSQNGREMAKMLHNAQKKFDWETSVVQLLLSQKQVIQGFVWKYIDSATDDTGQTK